LFVNNPVGGGSSRASRRTTSGGFFKEIASQKASVEYSEGPAALGMVAANRIIATIPDYR